MRWRRQQRGHQSTAGALPLKSEPLTLTEVPPRSWKASREVPREMRKKGSNSNLACWVVVCLSLCVCVGLVRLLGVGRVVGSGAWCCRLRLLSGPVVWPCRSGFWPPGTVSSLFLRKGDDPRTVFSARYPLTRKFWCMVLVYSMLWAWVGLLDGYGFLSLSLSGSVVFLFALRLAHRRTSSVPEDPSRCGSNVTQVCHLSSQLPDWCCVSSRIRRW